MSIPKPLPEIRRAAIITLLTMAATTQAAGVKGYYQFPAVHQETIVFTAEGDLWKTSIQGGLAQRLTTHHGVESHAAFSPDGNSIAFAANYEGPREIYTMPITGGLPMRRTFEGQSRSLQPHPVAWPLDNNILYTTTYFARRRNAQLATIDLASFESTPFPLSQASDGTFDSESQTLYFTRLPRQNSHAKRYTGGLIEKLWKMTFGSDEAVPITSDFKGTSRDPMLWHDRLYFTSDRDGTMNLWSMDLAGADLKQHTHFNGWDVLSPTLHDGRVVFQNQADLWLHEIDTNLTRKIPITLSSDSDQQREHWIKDPLEHLSAYAISPSGDRLAITVRGRVFVAPDQQGRLAQITRDSGVRYRHARFMPNGETLLLLSDRTGETEFWLYPANGVGRGTPLSADATSLRFQGIPSPGGKHIAYTSRDQRLRIRHREDGRVFEVATATFPNSFDDADFSWSPDSRYLAYVNTASNRTQRVFIYNLERQESIPVTTDRLESWNPVWSPDGTWLFFLSDRSFRSVQETPWGPRQPEPYLDRATKIYMLALAEEQRSPFWPDDEIQQAKQESKKTEAGPEPKKQDEKNADQEDVVTVAINFEGLSRRLYEVPIRAGNYASLGVTESHLYFTDAQLGSRAGRTLKALKIDNRDVEAKEVLADVRSYRLSADLKKMAVRKSNSFYIIDANGKPPRQLSKSKINLDAITFSVNPREEWRQIFMDAWRLHRDYFYDPEMHGVDWNAELQRHLPLLDRITTRRELDDLIAQMTGELSAMHTNIRDGDVRDGGDNIGMSYLGATWRRNEAKGGYQIEHIFQNDPDYPNNLSPLDRPGLGIAAGDTIAAINGVKTLSTINPAMLLRNQAGRQVLLTVLPLIENEPFDVIVRPIGGTAFRDLKLSEWEYTRRLRTDEQSDNQIGYFHMRAMSGGNFGEFVKGFYPVVNRKGLIVDMRQNFGGNIDSWILGRLIRQTWMYWKGRTGQTFGNMQYAFNGHMAVLIDAYTISDGEAFAAGFRSLGLGPLIGTQTWGGGIWLRSSNRLVDGGIARSPELGVFNTDGEWIIEGDGLFPDIEVDNLPHATFNGEDAQLEAAIEYLLDKIAEDPIETKKPQDFPNKSFDYDAAQN